MVKKLMLEEQETHIYYDVVDKCWTVDTSYPPHWRKLEKKEWECIRVEYYEDGSVQSKIFKSNSKKGISITNPNKTRNMSDEQREAARLRFLNRKNSPESDEIDEDEIFADFDEDFDEEE